MVENKSVILIVNELHFYYICRYIVAHNLFGIMKTVLLSLFCCFIIGCTSDPTKNKNGVTAAKTINNMVGINDTLGLSLHPENPVYSTKQKQVTFVLHNNSGINISFGGYYSYTYEDEKGIWRDVPMQLVVFDVEIILVQGNKFYYNAELFRRIPGRYRFFLTIRKYSKEYTLMTEFQLKDEIPQLLKSSKHLYNQQKDTLPPTQAVTEPFKIFDVMDKMPEFPGGMKALPNFIENNIQYPAEAQKKGIQGRVTVQFIVDENGYIIEPNIVRSVEPSLDKEALRIIKMLPQWKPGTLKGKAVKVKYTVPVAFKLNK